MKSLYFFGLYWSKISFSVEAFGTWYYFQKGFFNSQNKIETFFNLKFKFKKRAAFA